MKSYVSSSIKRRLFSSRIIIKHQTNTDSDLLTYGIFLFENYSFCGFRHHMKIKMKVALMLLVVVAALHVQSTQGQGFFRRGFNYARDFARGSRDMWRAYRDMRRANTIGADKYFHARGNYDAARHGTGGRHAATIISNAREAYQSGLSGAGAEDTAADQAANRWGRNGGDPNRYRPKGLDPRY